MCEKNEIMEARRKGFEVTAREHYFLHELDHSWSEREQEYHDSDMQVAWEVYNAALDSVCVELPPEWPLVCEKDEGANEMRNACIDAIELSGLRVKP